MVAAAVGVVLMVVVMAAVMMEVVVAAKHCRRYDVPVKGSSINNRQRRPYQTPHTIARDHWHQRWSPLCAPRLDVFEALLHTSRDLFVMCRQAFIAPSFVDVSHVARCIGSAH